MALHIGHPYPEIFRERFGEHTKQPRLSVGLYIAMGWLVVIAIKPLWDSLPVGGLLWLLAGGVAYTGGVVFYAATRLRYAHLVWHLCVLAGATCHFIAILKYAT